MKIARLGIAAALILMSSCSGCGPGTNAPVIRARDTFMLAYVTGNDNQIHVRSSDDGLDWIESTGLTAHALGGVGAGASNDAAGATRLLVYRDANSKLRTRAGLGTDTWETNDLPFLDPGVFSDPTALHLDGTRWLVSTTGDNGFASFVKIDTSTRQSTDQTPAGLAGLENDRPARTPSMANRGGRIVAAWPRFFFNGTGPISLQFVVGTVTGGSVQWQQAYAGTFDEPDFSPVRLGPALGHDGTRFYAAMVRQRGNTAEHRLFVYQSDDGVTWQPHSSLQVTVDGTTPKLRFAVKPDGVMVAAIFGDSKNVFLRRRGGWTGLNRGNVFGDGTEPDADDFALVAVGQARVPLFVNRTSTAQGEDGTADRPFRTIAAALQIARPGDTVTIQDNTLYDAQQLVVPRGVTLQASANSQMPRLRGRDDAPLITLERNTTLRGLQLDGGQQVVRIEAGTALQGLAGHATASEVRIEDCKISNALQGGIRLTGTVAAPATQVRILGLVIRRNWMTNNAGGAIVSEPIGPQAGVLALSLDISDNVIMNQREGIRLRAEGRGETAEPARTFYTGRVFNNVVSGGRTGFTLEAVGGGEVGRTDDALVVGHNTISGAEIHAIVAEAQDNVSRVRVALTANILANSGSGYTEFSARTSPASVRNNLFFQNGTHFRKDAGGGQNVNTAAGLNGAPVNGTANLIADPRFEVGSFRFNGGQFNSGEGNFFLRQGGANASPAVNAGPNPADDAGLATRTTRTDYAADTGVVDIGFHYRDS
jgi:hypothetical protein